MKHEGVQRLQKSIMTNDEHITYFSVQNRDGEELYREYPETKEERRNVFLELEDDMYREIIEMYYAKVAVIKTRRKA